jgi:NitT/TauT family transport system ATP-binding protein
MPAALELDDITVTFRSREGRSATSATPRSAHHAARRAGEFVSVVGPTGCGKSTLLNVAAGLLEPSSGEVRVFGEPLPASTARRLHVPGEALMPWRSAIDNVMVGLQYRGVPDAEARSRRRPGWRASASAGFGDRYPHQLSGGMRKRVALAQALALDPDIILMDEPFSALDIQTRQLMENEVLELWAPTARRCCSSRTISMKPSR